MNLRIALTILLCLAASAKPVATQREPYKGRRVTDVLQQLQREGTRILFSTSLVTPDLVVSSEPKPGSPREVAEQILAPHGLALSKGPRDTWLVVRATTIRPRPSAAPAEKRPSADRRPPADPPADPATATLKIEEQIDVIDRVGEFAGVPSVYAVDVGKVFETAGTFENVLGVLSTLPGAAATDDEEGKLAVRGAGPEHNALVFDGVQIHTPQRIGDFRTSFVNPATTDSIALDASGLDARHGGRLSSVTVLETRDGALDRRLAISGSAGLTSGDILVEGRVPGTASASWWATARGTYYKYVAKRFQDLDMPGFADAQFKVSARPSQETRFSVLALAGRETMHRPYDGIPDPRFLDGNVLREQRINNRLAVANLWWAPNQRFSTTSTLTGYSTVSRYQDHVKYWSIGPFDRRIETNDIGFRQRVSWAVSRNHALDTGVEVHWLRNRWTMQSVLSGANRRSVGPDTWGGRINYTDGPIDSRTPRTQFGAWLQDRIALGGAARIEPGVRVDWNSFTGETAVQPRLRITRSVGSGTAWAGVSFQAQTPGYETIQQGLAYFDLTGPEALRLNNERSRQIVAGIERSLGGGASVRIEGYHRAFDRLLVQQLETDAERERRLSVYFIPPDMPPDSAMLEHRPTTRPESTGTGRAFGLEVLLQRHRGRVTGWVSYAISKSERELYGRTVPFDFDRQHAIGAVVNVELTSRIRLSVNSQYASGFAITPLTPEVFFNDEPTFATPPYQPWRGGPNTELLTVSNPNGYFRVSLLNSGRMPAYARTDGRLTFEITGWLEVYGELINAFNRKNFHPNALLGPSQVPGEYEVSASMPRLPSYGVRVRF